MAGVNSPPAEIAKDWAAWHAYLVLVQKQAARISGSALAAALAGPAKAVEPARARLEKYAFTHCQ
jgi:hypothetical protein